MALIFYNLAGKIHRDAEQAIRAIYDYVLALEQRVQKVEELVKNIRTVINNPSGASLIGGFAQPVAGSATADSQLQTLLPDAITSTSTKVTAAAPYANDGYITAVVGGVTVKLMTTA